MSVPESTFTKPHAECPHPEWWSADDDESAEVEVVELVGALVRVLQPEYVVETGTFVGRMAQGIGQALLLNGHGRSTSSRRVRSGSPGSIRCSSCVAQSSWPIGRL